MGFFNNFGLLSDENPYKDSRDVSLWTIEYAVLCQKLCPLDMSIKVSCLDALNTITDGDIFYPCPNIFAFSEEGFSRESMVGLVSFGYFFGYPELASHGTKQFDNIRYLHPQDIVYCRYCAGKLDAKLSIWFLYASMLLTAARAPQTNSGALNTNEKKLCFLRLEALSKTSSMARKVYALFEKINAKCVRRYLEKHPREIPEGLTIDSNQWRLLFCMCFKRTDHPINLICKELFP